MTCNGLHCAGCAGGAAVPVVPIAAFLGADWVAQHLIEVAAVSAGCGAVSVAAVAALMRWCEHREARHAATRSIWAARPEAAPGPTAPAAVPASAHRELAGGMTIINNFYGADGEQVAARVIRQAIPGKAGDAVTREEEIEDEQR